MFKHQNEHSIKQIHKTIHDQQISSVGFSILDNIQKHVFQCSLAQPPVLDLILSFVFQKRFQYFGHLEILRGNRVGEISWKRFCQSGFGEELRHVFGDMLFVLGVEIDFESVTLKKDMISQEYSCNFQYLFEE